MDAAGKDAADKQIEELWMADELADHPDSLWPQLHASQDWGFVKQALSRISVLVSMVTDDPAKQVFDPQTLSLAGELVDLLRDIEARTAQLRVLNRRIKIEHGTMIARLVDPASEDKFLEAGIDTALQRLAAGKRLIDSGHGFAVLVIDNERAAAAMDRLLSGEIIHEGCSVDGYAVLGLEKYRNRLCLISCGDRADFTVDAIKQDYQLAA